MGRTDLDLLTNCGLTAIPTNLVRFRVQKSRLSTDHIILTRTPSYCRVSDTPSEKLLPGAKKPQESTQREVVPEINTDHALAGSRDSKPPRGFPTSQVCVSNHGSRQKIDKPRSGPTLRKPPRGTINYKENDS